VLRQSPVIVEEKRVPSSVLAGRFIFFPAMALKFSGAWWIACAVFATSSWKQEASVAFSLKIGTFICDFVGSSCNCGQSLKRTRFSWLFLPIWSGSYGVASK